jgi:DNA-binding MarR family transcriptional regulator
MKTANLFDPIERIVALMRAEERRRCAEFSLQPVHLQILDYLTLCNRYSDTPAALTNYLGMTRGTVSQTLQLLEKKQLVSKTSDEKDKRVVHLKILPAGKKLLAQVKPLDLFAQATELLQQNDQTSNTYEDFFIQALTALQMANNSQSFGLCKTCSHFSPKPKGGFCNLTKEHLTHADSEKICQEHSSKKTSLPGN